MRGINWRKRSRRSSGLWSGAPEQKVEVAASWRKRQKVHDENNHRYVHIEY